MTYKKKRLLYSIYKESYKSILELNLLKKKTNSENKLHFTNVSVTPLFHSSPVQNLTNERGAWVWAALTWLFSAAPSWDSSHGLAARSVPARSVSPPGTRCQPYSHMDDLWTFHTSPPLGPSCIIRSQQVSDEHEADFVPGAISYIESLYIRQNNEKGWQKFSVCIDRKLVKYIAKDPCATKWLWPF